MYELCNAEVKIMVLEEFSGCWQAMDLKAAVRTPTQAMSVPTAFRNGTICLPFVTELSRLGLNASPENNVRREGWST
jgi:hypothetical protein